MDDKEKAKSEFAWRVHSYISDYIRFADTKAGAIIAWCGGLIGILLAAQAHHNFTKTSFTLTDPEWLTTGIAAVTLLAFLLLAAGVISAFMCIKPRLWSHEGMKGHPKGYVYWEDVKAHVSADIFKRELGSIGVGGFGDMCAEHTFVLAAIASKKYWWVNWSLWIAFAGSIAAAISRLLA
jgi:hypothetical protein